MNTTHILLVVIIVILAFGAGFFVARSLMSGGVNSNQVSEDSNASEEATAETMNEDAAETNAASSQGTTINTSNLSDGQRALLKTLGIDADTITITPQMVACAEGKVGADRLREIEGGATPSFSEGLQLASCYR